MAVKTAQKTFVTVPSLGSLEEYMELLQIPWESGILTHNGPLVRQLEEELNQYLNINSMIAVTNGTVALQLALKALNLKGEIITTPFSWIATCSSIIWEHCTPVFVDIDPNTFNLDPAKIESALSHKTVGIMPVHVFSNPCDVVAIDEIGKRNGLKVIYDAAHAMCVDVNGKSILEYGDISATSFHATKLFNTGEGGGCTSPYPELYEKMKRIRFFGHNDAKEIIEDGCNGKMTEIHAALGLVNMRYLDSVREQRKTIFDKYVEGLHAVSERFQYQKIDQKAYNYSYMPLVFESEEILLGIDEALKASEIYGRRYFYPSLNLIRTNGPYHAMPVSEDIAKRIYCLPSHSRLTAHKQEEIIEIVSKVLQ